MIFKMVAWKGGHFLFYAIATFAENGGEYDPDPYAYFDSAQHRSLGINSDYFISVLRLRRILKWKSHWFKMVA